MHIYLAKSSRFESDDFAYVMTAADVISVPSVVMEWHPTGAKPLPVPMMTQFASAYLTFRYLWLPQYELGRGIMGARPSTDIAPAKLHLFLFSTFHQSPMLLGNVS